MEGLSSNQGRSMTIQGIAEVKDFQEQPYEHGFDAFVQSLIDILQN